MGFQVSPGVEIKEFDLTAIVPAVSTTPSGFVGAFQWGPSEQRVLINSEKTLRETFGNPSKETLYSTSWFVAQNFLTYGSNLLIGRVLLDDDKNAVDSLSNPVVIKNRADFEEQYGVTPNFAFNFAAKYPGILANGMTVLLYDIQTLGQIDTAAADTDLALSFDAATLKRLINRDAPNTSSFAAALNSNANDEIHIVVIDTTGKISGTPGTVLETFLGLSKAPNAKNPDGTTNFWRNVLNNKSLYLWAGVLEQEADISTDDGSGITEDGTIAWDQEVNLTVPYKRIGLYEYTMNGGQLTNIELNRNAAESDIAAAFDTLFGDPEDVDVSLLIAGDLVNPSHLNEVVRIAEERKDCVAFISPPTQSVIDNASARAQYVLDFRNDEITPSSYGVMDSGPKYK
jgi:hypothetical protein